MSFDVKSEEGQKVLEDLDKDVIKVTDLEPEKRDAVLNYLMENPEVTDPEPEPEPKSDDKPDEKPVEEPDKEQKKEQEPGDKEIDPKETIAYWKEKHQALANENNKLTQKAKSANERANKFKSELDEVVKGVKVEETDDDPYDEQNFKPFVKDTRTNDAILNAKMDFVLKKLSERDQHDAKYYTDQAVQTEEQKTFAAINRLQGEFPTLKTKESFENLNNAWGLYTDKLVQAAEFGEEYKETPQSQKQAIALDMIEKNPLFQEKVKKLGIEVPEPLQDKDEFDKYNTILDLHKEGGDLIATYLKRQFDSGTLQTSIEKQKQEAALKASNETANAIENKSPTSLTPDDGPGVTEGELTTEKAKLVLKALNDVSSKRLLTPEEKKQFGEALAHLEKDMGLIKE